MTIDSDLVSRLTDHVDFLTSDECAGRAPGTPGGRLARRHIVDQLRVMGVAPHGQSGFESPIDGLEDAANVVGAISANRSDRTILIAAHYDHLGMLWNDVYRGADDNASGVAVVLEVARMVVSKSADLGRSVVICSFDAEEPPHFLAQTMGSIQHVESLSERVDSIDLMINLDLVGHRLGAGVLPPDLQQGIFVLGSETGAGIPGLVDSTPATELSPWRISQDAFAALSDHHAFAAAGVPWLFFTSGRNRHYHTRDDTSDHIDTRRLAALTSYLADLVMTASHLPDPIRRDSIDPNHLNTVERLAELCRAIPGHDVRTLSLIEGLRQRIEARGHLKGHELGSLQLAYLKVEELLR